MFKTIVVGSDGQRGRGAAAFGQALATATGALGQPDTYDAGFTIQQEFDVYVTVFYVEPGSPNYSALADA